MAIEQGTRFHGVHEPVKTVNKGSKLANSRRDAYTIEEISQSAKVGVSVENTSVTGTYAVDLSKDNHELTLTGATTLGVTNTPSVGKTVVVTLYITSAVDQALTIPAGWTQYGGTYAADATRNQLALSVSNNAVSGLVFDLSISNSN
tara:strand:- start:2855 stop:3295 length:441 start_codon:yes stop_codon:yes gene_type:complete